MKSTDTKRKYLDLVDEKSVPKTVIRETVKDILLLAEKELGKKRLGMTVLDIGSGFGLYSQELAKEVKNVVAVEPFTSAHDEALKSNRAKNIHFVNALIENYKGNKKFDLAISLTTLEHMPKAEKSFSHVLKYMKKKSLLYVTAPNKLWPVEPHYALPFLSWLPLPLANVYLKITGKGTSYKDSSYSLTYFGMQRLFSRFPYKYSFVVPPSDAIYLGCGSQSLKSKSIRKTGIWLIKKFPIFWLVSKGFILVVKKEE